MREQMSASLRKALDSAQSAARELDQDFVGAEHLLLGILDAGESEALTAFATNEIALPRFRRALVASLPRGKDKPIVTGKLPFSPKATRAVNAALARAQAGSELRVSTRLLLLSLLEEPESAARQALRDCGGDVEQLQRVLRDKPAKAES